LSLAGDILRNKAAEAVIAAARAVDSEGNPVELPTEEQLFDSVGNVQDVNAVEAEIIDPASDADGLPDGQGSEGPVFEAEIVDEES
jgi:hypothetical protein